MRPFERPVDGVPLEDQREESDQPATATRTPGGSPTRIPTPPAEAE